MGVRIASKVIDGSVCVRCGDIVKSLYADLSLVNNEATKNYIKICIKEWELYEDDILKKAANL